MTLTLGTVLESAGIDPLTTLVIRHAYVRDRSGEYPGINAASSADDIMEYTRRQGTGANKFPVTPPRTWVVFLPEGGDRARLWSVIHNSGETSNNGTHRWYDLEHTEQMADLRERLVLHWRSPRTWWLTGKTAARYPVAEIADSTPDPFPGFDRISLDYSRLQEVMREHRFATWRTALSSVLGIYVITDMRDGKQYVGKADGVESIHQRWAAYAANGHGGNVELRTRDPLSFRFSLLRVFDPSTPHSQIDAAERHFKHVLGTREHGLNRN